MTIIAKGRYLSPLLILSCTRDIGDNMDKKRGLGFTAGCTDIFVSLCEDLCDFISSKLG